MQITFLTLYIDCHKNVSFSNGKILTFGLKSRELNAILVSYDR